MLTTKTKKLISNIIILSLITFCTHKNNINMQKRKLKKYKCSFSNKDPKIQNLLNDNISQTEEKEDYKLRIISRNLFKKNLENIKYSILIPYQDD
ncbi:MAG: hypothetical protein GY823_06335 [Flavobacteriaceae bacterium]|nr:hypothetical protein [Flavobacteriaceae bacterium]